MGGEVQLVCVLLRRSPRLRWYKCTPVSVLFSPRRWYKCTLVLVLFVSTTMVPRSCIMAWYQSTPCQYSSRYSSYNHLQSQHCPRYANTPINPHSLSHTREEPHYASSQTREEPQPASSLAKSHGPARTLPPPASVASSTAICSSAGAACPSSTPAHTST